MLGETSINGQIAETAKNSPEMFWYFNKGITLLCDKIEKNLENRDNRDFGFFKTVNASIVNGAQTVSVIGKLMKEGVDLSRLEVPFRAIEIDQGLVETKKAITRTNNTQNEILSKDFIAQDELQESLQKQVRLLDFTYQIKRDNDFKESDTSFDLNEAIEALVLLSKQANLSATFRNEVGKFHVADRAPYKTLFNPSLSGYRLINSIKILRELHKLAKDELDSLQADESYGRKNQILTNGLLLIGQIELKNKNLNNLNKDIVDPKEMVNQSEFKDAFDKVFSYCETNYKGNYLRTPPMSG